MIEIGHTVAQVLSREDWLALHRKPGIITASMVSTILGINKWCSPFTLYQRFIGDVPWQETTIRMRKGHQLEPLVADLYEEETGRTLTDPGDYAVYWHPDYEWLLCTLDRLTVDERDKQGVVEMKAPGEFRAKEWREGPPLEHQVQVQVQMAILGTEWGSIAGLVGGEFFHPDVERHDKVLAAMWPRLAEFRDRVLAHDPPPEDGSDSTTATLKVLHPQDSGNTIFVAGLGELWHKRARLKEDQGDAKKGLQEVENQIRGALGENTFAKDELTQVSYKTQSRRGYLKVEPSDDTKARLSDAGIAFKETKSSTCRVLREVKRHGD